MSAISPTVSNNGVNEIGAISRNRLNGLDALRGLAVLLMVADHLLLLVDPDHWLRFTVTRASLPLFAAVAGYLWRPGWRWRYVHVWVAGLVASIAGSIVGVGQPDVLWVILVAFVAVWAVDSLDLPDVGTVAVAVLLLAIANTGWHWTLSGYDPRWVAGFMLIGRTVDLPRLGVWLEGSRVLEYVGRHPLGWYVGHVALLGVLVIATRIT